MPNWCSNTLHIRGPKDEVENFIELIIDKTSRASATRKYCVFRGIIPMPEELENTNSPSEETDERKAELMAKYGAFNWYDWALKNWGTKWGCCDQELSEIRECAEGAEVYFNYETAWAPGDDQLFEALQQFDKLSFHLYYEEQGMGFAGYNTMINGVHDGANIYEMNVIPKSLNDIF